MSIPYVNRYSVFVGKKINKKRSASKCIYANPKMSVKK